MLIWGIPASLGGAALIMTISRLGGPKGLNAGRGSSFLVFLHLLSKLTQVWGEAAHSHYTDEEGWQEEEEEDTNDTTLQGGGNSNNVTSSVANALSESVHPAPVSHARSQLAERGQSHSPLVSLGLSTGPLAEHWLPLASRRYVFFVANLFSQIFGMSSESHILAPPIPPPSPQSRKSSGDISLQKPVLSPNTFSLATLLRAGTGLAVSAAALLGAISVASVLQQDTGFFPDLMDFYTSASSLHFDHRISNITLYKYINLNISNAATCPVAMTASKGFNETSKVSSYAACSWSWKGQNAATNVLGLTLFDLSLLAEVAYLGDSQSNLHHTLSQLFPDLDFEVVHAPSVQSAGPMYLEVRSKTLGGTVIAVRGTDVGRLRDLLEDARLYAEPIIFSLLGVVFPPMQLWSDATAGAVVQLLHDATEFFGPLAVREATSDSFHEEHQKRDGHSEAGIKTSYAQRATVDYFQPLVRRVLQLVESGEEVLLTGHSLGGGLAGVVGAFTGRPSVAFSSPGLGLCYRKFRAQFSDGSWRRLHDRAALHHQSLSVVTEYDWYDLNPMI